MKFTVSSTGLLRELQFLKGVIPSNSTLPILDNFLFEISNGKLSLKASDLENTMIASIDVEAQNNLSVAVPANLLIDILKTFPEQPLVFTINNNGTIKISSSTGDYEIAHYPAEEYPKYLEIENPSTATVPSEVLAKAITKTIFATGNDDLRPAMSGVFFQFSQTGLIFAATDAHKLVKYARTDITAETQAEFIMPKKPLSVLKTILPSASDDVVIEYNDSNAVFKFDKYLLSARLVDAKYPNYEAVIPKENPNKMTIGREELLKSVKRVALLSNKTTHQVAFKIVGNELNISAEDIDFSNKGDERLACVYEGEDLRIGFNSRYLTEMLSNMTSEEVLLEMSMPNRAGLLTPVDGLVEGESLLLLVMPVILNN